MVGPVVHAMHDGESEDTKSSNSYDVLILHQISPTVYMYVSAFVTKPIVTGYGSASYHKLRIG